MLLEPLERVGADREPVAPWEWRKLCLISDSIGSMRASELTWRCFSNKLHCGFEKSNMPRCNRENSSN